MNPLLFVAALTLLPAEATEPAPSHKAERIVLWATAAADVLTTRMAIIDGAREGNPILNRIIGKRPSTLKLVGAKLAAIAVVEWEVSRLRKQGKHKQAKALYLLSSLMWGYASGFNFANSVFK